MPLNAKLKITWLLLIISGVIFFGIGIFSFIDPFSSYLKLVKFTGICLLINGIMLIFAAATNKRYPRERIWMQTESILHLFFAMLFLFNPLLTFIALPFITGAWIFLVGIFKIIAALSLKRFVRGWGFIFWVGILCVFFGSLLIIHPFPKASGVTTVIGVFGLIMGFLYIVDAFRYRKMEDTLDLML
ncbi:HdeD family acid-resistance protein [Flavitalea flava]